MSTLTFFPLFPNLPTELRLKIWGFAANLPASGIPIAICCDFKKYEENNSIMYHQSYKSPLSQPYTLDRALLSVSSEARAEALQSFELGFGTETTMVGFKVGDTPNIRVNWTVDTLLPRGYWNLIAFEDFLQRGVYGRMCRLAIDPMNSFWTDNVKRYCANGIWPFLGTEEVVLYSSTGMGIFKVGYSGGPKTLKFSPVDEQGEYVGWELLTSAKRELEALFDNIEKKKEGTYEEAEGEKDSRRNFLVDAPEFVDYFRRPTIRIMEIDNLISNK